MQHIDIYHIILVVFYYLKTKIKVIGLDTQFYLTTSLIDYVLFVNCIYPHHHEHL